jgi:putative copper resistance protein D
VHKGIVLHLSNLVEIILTQTKIGEKFMVSTIIHFLHLLATVVWIGGMIFLEAVFYPSLGAIDPQQAGKALSVVAKRFTIVAWSCIVILIITGLLKTPSGWLFDTSSTIGIILLVKHLLIVAVIIVSIIITFVVAPKLISAFPKPGESPTPAFLKSQQRIKVLSGTNLIIGVLILLLTTLLQV